MLNGRDSYFIELFKRADLSTLFHELAHTYFLSMERYVHDGMADAEMQGFTVGKITQTLIDRVEVPK